MVTLIRADRASAALADGDADGIPLVVGRRAIAARAVVARAAASLLAWRVAVGMVAVGMVAVRIVAVRPVRMVGVVGVMRMAAAH